MSIIGYLPAEIFVEVQFHTGMSDLATRHNGRKTILKFYDKEPRLYLKHRTIGVQSQWSAEYYSGRKLSNSISHLY